MEVDHKKLAKEYFNETWDLIDKTERTEDEKFEMIHKAHASRFHWGFAGEDKQFATGEWQISHVYALLGMGESALFHGRRCLWYALEKGLSDFNKAFGYEAVARAYRVMGDDAAAEENKRLGLSYAEKEPDESERKYVTAEIIGI